MYPDVVRLVEKKIEGKIEMGKKEGKTIRKSKKR